MDKDISARFEALEKRVAAVEKRFETEKPASAQKQLSVKEFILSKAPKNDVERTLAIGYYLERFDGKTAFSVQDIDTGFRSAKEKVPDNLNDKVNQNIKKGHMMEAKIQKGAPKAWNLTSSGERLVESGFAAAA
ncbi:MAG: hypothetical protein V1839_03960 [archaeon]